LTGTTLTAGGLESFTLPEVDGHADHA